MALKYINVLILGGTGMGKSTMLNMMSIVTEFRTINEAIKGTFTPPIPIQTAVSDEFGNEHIVSYGNDTNEKLEVGQSATQKCKKYEFTTPEGVVRILDTPGLADTEGIVVDDKHLSNILDAITELDEIHRIIFVLKANSTRISAEFKYCLNALFTRISKTAKNNVVFVFTNGRTAFYGPGTTNGMVDLMLKEVASKAPYVKIPLVQSNKFVFDNECLAFIIGMKNGIQFSDFQKQCYKMSWEKAVKEYRRLFEFIFACEEPHRVIDTVNVCNIRELIALLVRPLAEVTELIQDNTVLVKQHEKVVQNSADNIEDLKANLYTPHVESDVVELDHPRTICVSPTCSEVVNWGSIKKYRPKPPYCHSHCYLGVVQRELINNADILKCAAMNNTNNCVRCPGKCSYMTHMHVYYEIEDKYVRYKDPNCEQDLKTNEDAKLASEKKLRELSQRLRKLKHEQETINKCTALFAEFLQRNPIASYNYAFEDYLKHLIENKKMVNEGTGTSVKEMEEVLKAHRVERKVFEDSAVAAGGAYREITPEEIFKKVDELYDLEIFGKRIKDTVEQQKKARAAETSIKEPVSLDRSKDNYFFKGMSCKR